MVYTCQKIFSACMHHTTFYAQNPRRSHFYSRLSARRLCCAWTKQSVNPPPPRGTKQRQQHSSPGPSHPNGVLPKPRWSCRHFQPPVVAKSDCKLRPEIQKWNEFSGEVRIPNVQCSHPQVHGTTKSVLSRDRMLCEPQSTKVNGNAMWQTLQLEKEGMSRREGCAE